MSDEPTPGSSSGRVASSWRVLSIVLVITLLIVVVTTAIPLKTAETVTADWFTFAMPTAFHVNGTYVGHQNLRLGQVVGVLAFNWSDNPSTSCSLNVEAPPVPGTTTPVTLYQSGNGTGGSFSTWNLTLWSSVMFSLLCDQTTVGQVSGLVVSNQTVAVPLL